MDIPLQSPNTQSNVCSTTRKEDLQQRLKNYTQKLPHEPFIQGQKYYVIDKNIPNCVNSIVCKQTFNKGDKHSSLGKDANGNDNTFPNHKCFSYDSKYNIGNETKQLDTLVDNYDEHGEFNKFTTKISNKKYKYQLDTSNPNNLVYYRKCSMFGCKAGTSLMDISLNGAGKTKRKKQKNKKLRRTRKH
jgi:hypothetical protein